MQAEKAGPKDIVMVGDAAGDRIAAEQAGCLFEQAGGDFSFKKFTRRMLKE